MGSKWPKRLTVVPTDTSPNQDTLRQHPGRSTYVGDTRFVHISGTPDVGLRSCCSFLDSSISASLDGAVGAIIAWHFLGNDSHTRAFTAKRHYYKILRIAKFFEVVSKLLTIRTVSQPPAACVNATFQLFGHAPLCSRIQMSSVLLAKSGLLRNESGDVSQIQMGVAENHFGV